MDTTDYFNRGFEALTGTPPFPWQRALFLRFLEDRPDNIPASCNLPTGLGKTSVVAIWLLALAHAPARMPRRLVYVVNRRTVVDQTTNEAEKYRRLLVKPETAERPEHINTLQQLAAKLRKRSDASQDDPPIAISTLRGQFADNREWSADPSRPAIIIGTVDMIGSRLLFSGYGVGFKSKPLHAGFLGQDVLLVHDEAHLEPAFQKLLVDIETEQKRERRNQPELAWQPLRVMELTATTRGKGDVFPNDEEREANEADPLVRKRVRAAKTIRFHDLQDEKKLAEQLAGLALEHRDSQRAILVFARTVEDVGKIADRLQKDVGQENVETLTGTRRGKERDELVEKPVFKRFLPHAPDGNNTVYLVCTSAGEVGVNISADHLVCDLSTFESMAQRFGRVNRFGNRDDTRIDIVPPTAFKDDVLDQRRRETLKLLRELNDDGSPAALGRLAQRHPDIDKTAFAPEPIILETSDILFDAWALTTIRGKLPGRPPVEPYLHGMSDWQPPETHVAWRKEVWELRLRDTDDNERNMREAEDRRQLARFAVELLEDFPLKPHELLRDISDRVFKHIVVIAERHPDFQAWLLDDEGTLEVLTLKELANKDRKDRLYRRTILLPPQAGGLKAGLLDGGSQATNLDVCDQWYEDAEKTIKRRERFRSDDLKPEKKDGMRLVREIDLEPDAEDSDVSTEDNGSADGETQEDKGRYWRWYVRLRSADDDASKTAIEPIRWQHHTNDVEEKARRLADVLLKDFPDLHTALLLAARWHDLGKKRAVWQRSIGHRLPKSPKPEDWLAKSGGKMRPLELTDYRHEFGSLVEATTLVAAAELEEFGQQPESVRELILHLIATHHGFARPHFPLDQAFDPDHGETSDVAAAVPRRFAKLQRKYGCWGLAYLESLLRAADWAASAKPSPNGENQS